MKYDLEPGCQLTWLKKPSGWLNYLSLKTVAYCFSQCFYELKHTAWSSSEQIREWICNQKCVHIALQCNEKSQRKTGCENLLKKIQTFVGKIWPDAPLLCLWCLHKPGYHHLIWQIELRKKDGFLVSFVQFSLANIIIYNPSKKVQMPQRCGAEIAVLSSDMWYL